MFDLAVPVSIYSFVFPDIVRLRFKDAHIRMF